MTRVKYLLLLYDDVEATAAMGPEERRMMVEEHIAYSRMLGERGALVSGEPLNSPETARTVRFDSDGQALVTDGPFIEAKEALGGFYVLECASPDEAMRLAVQVPRSPGLVAELRPIPDV